MDTAKGEHYSLRISVVIATLGGKWINDTIDSLMNGSLAPGEILICIPADFVGNVSHLSTDVVKIVPTEVKGQVRQRAIGFTKASGALVLQLDDDVLLEKGSLQQMAAHIQSLGRGNVVGPVFYGRSSLQCIHDMQMSFTKNLFDYLICAAPWGKRKMGKVTEIGLNYGVDDRFCSTELYRTDWLSGGCVLSFREDLVTQDFFPFPGKAYCEDVIHSHFRREAGVISWVACRVKVSIEEPEPEFSPHAVEKVIVIRRHLLQLLNGPQWRLSVYEWFCRIRGRLYTSTVKNAF
jgi:hypothetical protein